MGWQTDPIVSASAGGSKQPAWMSDPVVNEAAEQPNERSFADSMKLGLKKRALGIAELGANAVDAIGIAPESVKGFKQLVGDVGQNYAREGTGTGFKGAIGEIAGDPLSYLPVASLPKFLAQGAAMGATAPTGNENSNLFDNAKNSVGGAAASLAGYGAGKVIGKVARPAQNQLGKAGKAAVRILEDAGVPLTAAQRTGSKALASLESVFATLPMTSASQNKIYSDQADEFTKAALGKAGIQADDAGRKVIADAADAFGKEYKALAVNNVMNVDKQLKNAAASIGLKAKGRMGKDASDVVKTVIGDIRKAKGAISGEVYHETRKMLTQKANASKDAFDAGLMKQLRNELDSAFERSLPKAQQGLMANINKRYQSFKPIQKAMESSKTNVLRSGNIDPTALYQQVDVGAPLSDLADAGAALLRPTIPDSGTAQRVMMQNLVTGGVAGAGALGANSENPYAKAAGYSALALAAPRAGQILYNNPRVQNYMAEGIGYGVQPAAKALGRALPTAAASGYSGNIEQPNQSVQSAPVELQSEKPQSSLFQRVIQQESAGRQFDKDGNPLESVIIDKKTGKRKPGAIGIAQVMPGTAKEAAKLAGLPYSEKRYRTDAEYNAALGEAYLNKQLEDFGGNEALALMAYNWGPDATRKWLKRGAKERQIPAETKNYLKKILEA